MKIIPVIVAVSILLAPAPFTDTAPVEDGDPSRMEDQIRVEVPHESDSYAQEIADSPSKYVVDIKTTSSADKTVYIAVDHTQIYGLSENITDMTLWVDGTQTTFTTEETLNRTWIGFTTTQEDPNVELFAAGVNPGDTLGPLQLVTLQFKKSPITVVLLLTVGVVGTILAYQYAKSRTYI